MTDDLRGGIGDSLRGHMSQEKIDQLLDAILSVEKAARGWCPSCKKQVRVTIPDASAVTKGLVELANQAWGRPDVAQGAGDESRIVFERVVYLSEGEAS